MTATADPVPRLILASGVVVGGGVAVAGVVVGQYDAAIIGALEAVVFAWLYGRATDV